MINFSELVKELVESGLSEARIADAVGASQPTINRIKLAKQTNIGYSLGNALVVLHRTRTRRKARAAA